MSVDIVTAFGELLTGEGGRDYLGEEVTIAAHLLQAGGLAMAAGAPDALVAAALLHDVGHFFESEKHDDAGARWLGTWFGEEVTQPVRLHVLAKRYLCTVEPSYFDILSPASVHTLTLQGGRMSADEVAEFEANPYHRDGIAVRRWDDEAKDPKAATPDYADFVPILTKLAK
ncbi:MAG TPA: HD domain-containing protein [Pseudonocardiaceae bacterium]